MATKRIVVLSDLHCGHRVGLTPPAWQLAPADDAEPQRMKWVKIQRECWAWYVAELRKVRPIHLLIVNGDLVDGPGHRSGGTELITPDSNSQVEMAVKCIQAARAKSVRIVRGTPYHVGEASDMEDQVAAFTGAKIGNHEWFDVNGVVFDCKHFIGASAIPHGRHTPIARDRLWNALWSEAGLQPKSDVLIRSHVHYHAGAFGSRGDGSGWLAMTTPALQAMGTRYGSRQCSGLVDYGFVSFEVNEKGAYSWHAHLARIISQVALSEKV